MAMLNFKGKGIVQNHHLAVPFHELTPSKKKSLSSKPKLDDNLIIHGDNLLALKALLPTYAGRVKCIYIDPPYNTGNEGWVYNDRVNNPMMKEWLGKVVDREDLTRHDKWLCMMMPRLKLLRELLSDDGVIFVSIDDNEVHHLRMLMDDVFGEDNFVAELPTIMNLKGNQDQFGFAGTHEYTLVWAKNKFGNFQIGEFDIDEEELGEWKKDEIGFYKRGANLKSSGANAPREMRPNLYFPIYVTENNRILLDPTDREKVEKLLPISEGKEMSWRWGKEKISREAHNLMVVRDEESISIYKKQRPSLGDLPTKKPKSVFYKPEYSSGNGTAQLKTIFGKKIFNNPKPVDLILDFLRIQTDSDSIILDSFSGSGTTAHATLSLNREDGGNRKFILVEMEDYADTITAERVRRVIKGVKGAKDEDLKKGLGGTFSYFELGKAIDEDGLLSGKALPTYGEMARYVFHVATGEAFDAKKLDRKKHFIGESEDYKVYLIYEPNVDKLKELALTLPFAETLGKRGKKRNLVFAPTKYLSPEDMETYRIEFAQLPFEIYRRIT